MAKIALPTYGTEGLNSTVYPMLESTPYITIISMDDSGNIEDVRSIPMTPSFYPGFPQNPIQLLLNEGVNIVIVGSIMPQTATMLKQNGINIYMVPPNSTVKEAIDKFTRGELKEYSIQPPSQPGFQTPPGFQYPPLMYPTQYPSSTYPQTVPPPFPQTPPSFPQQIAAGSPRESFLKILERQRDMLKQQKWMLERQKEMIEKQLELINDQIKKIESKIEETKSS